MTTIDKQVQLEIFQGVCCGGWIALPAEVYRHELELASNGRGFYCSNGHKQIFAGESATDQIKRLNKEVQHQTMERDYYRTQTGDLIEQVKLTRRQASAAKGQLTKLKRRTDNGVCPHCHRTVGEMAQHIKDMHPEVDVRTASETIS